MGGGHFTCNFLMVALKYTGYFSFTIPLVLIKCHVCILHRSDEGVDKRKVILLIHDHKIIFSFIKVFKCRMECFSFICSSLGCIKWFACSNGFQASASLFLVMDYHPL